MLRNIKKLTCIFTILILVAVNNISTAESIINDTNETSESAPILEVYIRSQLNVFSICFTVKNVGDADATNIEMSSITFEGNVIYNSRPLSLVQKLGPEKSCIRSYINYFLGFGTFNVTITAGCSEGVYGSSSVSGLIIGPIVLIP